MNDETKPKRRLNIGVKHYLNTKLKPHYSADSEEPKYPLYVQITVKGQTTRIKSILGAYVSESDFNLFSSQYLSDIFQESVIIQRKILDLSDVGQPNFKFHNIEYDGRPYEISQLVYNALHDKVYSLLSKVIGEKMPPLERIRNRARYSQFPAEPISGLELEQTLNEYGLRSSEWNPDSIVFEPSTSFRIREDYHAPRRGDEDINFLSLLLSGYFPGFADLREKFKPEIWDFDSYVDKIKYDNNRFLITIDEWRSGDFNRDFMNSWNDQEALDGINAGIERILAEDPEISEYISRYERYTTILSRQ